MSSPPLSGLMNLYLQSVLPIDFGATLYISAGAKPSGTLDLFTKGPGLSCSWGELHYNTWGDIDFTTWAEWCPISTGIVSGGLNLTTNGATVITLSGNIPLFIPNAGTGTISGSMILFEETENAVSGSFPLFVKTDPIPTNNLDLFVKGEPTEATAISGVPTNTLDLFVEGDTFITQSGNMPLMIKVVSTGDISINRTLFMTGTTLTTAGLDLYVHNDYIGNNFSCFIQGYWTVFGGLGGGGGTIHLNAGGFRIGSSLGSLLDYNPVSALVSRRQIIPPSPEQEGEPISLIIFEESFDPRNNNIFGDGSRDGAIPDTGNLPLFINTVGSSGSMPLFVASGAVVVEDNIPLYVSGISGIDGSMDLFMASGVEIINANRPLVTHGYLAGV